MACAQTRVMTLGTTKSPRRPTPMAPKRQRCQNRWLCSERARPVPRESSDARDCRGRADLKRKAPFFAQACACWGGKTGEVVVQPLRPSKIVWPRYCLSTNYRLRDASHRNNGDHIKVFEQMDRIPSHWVSCPKFSCLQEGFEVPRYFFHVNRGQVTVLDQEGIELANAAQAEEEAARRAQQCLADNAWNGRFVEPWNDYRRRRKLAAAI